MGNISAGRVSDYHQICQPVNLPVEMEGVKSADRFSDCQQIFQALNLPAVMGG